MHVPTNVAATPIEFLSSDEIPKSESLHWPRELSRILEGLMSRCNLSRRASRLEPKEFGRRLRPGRVRVIAQHVQ